MLIPAGAGVRERSKLVPASKLPRAKLSLSADRAEGFTAGCPQMTRRANSEMKDQPTEISTGELAARAGEPEHVLIDGRPSAAYHGWRLRDEPRGGHVPGARSLPARWCRTADPASILRANGVSADRSLTVYGYDPDTAWEIARNLSTSEFRAPAVHPAFLDEWVADTTRPLESLARYRQLVYPGWVRELTRGEDPPAGPAGSHVLCHVHFADHADYEAGHIPGAIPLDTTRLEAPDGWNRRSQDALARALREHGIRHDTTVVLYGRPADHACSDGGAESTDGHLGAMRCAAIMLYAGVEDVRVLNGGLANWTATGYDLTTRPTDPQPVESFGTTVPARPELVIDTPEAKAWLAAEDRELVSVRSYGELAGETSGYDYIERRGRIPGAILAPSGSDPQHVEEYRSVDHAVRDYHAIAERWAELGIVPDKAIAFYCGTGWRSSEAFVIAHLMGWPDIAVYDGGWSEWSSDPDNPIERSELPRRGADRPASQPEQ